MSRNQLAIESPLRGDDPLAAHGHSGRFGVWVDAPDKFRMDRVQPIHHNFHEHPLMQLPALASLARELSKTRQCRYISPGTQQSSVFNLDREDPEGRGVDKVFDRIGEPGAWIALYNVATHPTYKAFLSEVASAFRPLVDTQQPGMFGVDGFIFISAPPSVTPFHIDRENNFWLQIRGRKTMNVWDPRDRTVVDAAAVDDFIVNADLGKVRLMQGFRERSHEFDVGPGDGVYFPATSPHMTSCDPAWVTADDRVVISIGVVFFTDVTRRAANVHFWNRFLRRLGGHPREPGQSIWLDRLKHPLGRSLMWVAKTFRGYTPRPGMQ